MIAEDRNGFDFKIESVPIAGDAQPILYWAFSTVIFQTM
jgi:hypothetical protein